MNRPLVIDRDLDSIDERPMSDKRLIRDLSHDIFEQHANSVKGERHTLLNKTQGNKPVTINNLDI